MIYRPSQDILIVVIHTARGASAVGGCCNADIPQFTRHLPYIEMLREFAGVATPPPGVLGEDVGWGAPQCFLMVSVSCQGITMPMKS